MTHALIYRLMGATGFRDSQVAYTSFPDEPDFPGALMFQIWFFVFTMELKSMD